MTVLVGDTRPRGREPGVVTTEDVPLNQPLSLTPIMSEALLGSPVHSTDPENPIVATVTGHERDGDGQVIASAQGDEVAFQSISVPTG